MNILNINKKYEKAPRWTIAQQAKIFGVTPDRIRERYAELLPGKRKMLEKALATGKKVNGYIAEQLKDSLDRYTAMSTARDDQYELREGERYGPDATTRIKAVILSHEEIMSAQLPGILELLLDQYTADAESWFNHESTDDEIWKQFFDWAEDID